MNTVQNFATAILVRGIPGSGKSYITAVLIDEIGRERVIILDPDEINKQSDEYSQLTARWRAEGVDEKFYPYRFLMLQADEAIAARKVIVWNQPFGDLVGFRKTIARLREYADNHRIELRILVVEVEIDEKVAHQRVTARKQLGGHGPTPQTFVRFVGQYHTFVNEGHKTVTVRGENHPTEAVTTIMKALEELWV